MSLEPLGDGDPAVALEVADLRIHLESADGPLPVVDGIDLRVKAGRTLCIVGESGCGKSLTALAVMGLLPSPPARVAGGRVVFEGTDLLGLDRHAMRALRGSRLAMIFQEPMTSLNPAFTIGDQLGEAILCHRPIGRQAAEARALEMLERVRIPAAANRLDDYPHQLSGGMRHKNIHSFLWSSVLFRYRIVLRNSFSSDEGMQKCRKIDQSHKT